MNTPSIRTLTCASLLGAALALGGCASNPSNARWARASGPWSAAWRAVRCLAARWAPWAVLLQARWLAMNSARTRTRKSADRLRGWEFFSRARKARQNSPDLGAKRSHSLGYGEHLQRRAGLFWRARRTWIKDSQPLRQRAPCARCDPRARRHKWPAGRGSGSSPR